MGHGRLSVSRGISHAAVNRAIPFTVRIVPPPNLPSVRTSTCENPRPGRASPLYCASLGSGLLPWYPWDFSFSQQASLNNSLAFCWVNARESKHYAFKDHGEAHCGARMLFCPRLQSMTFMNIRREDLSLWCWLPTKPFFFVNTRKIASSSRRCNILHLITVFKAAKGDDININLITLISKLNIDILKFLVFSSPIYILK